ncbi:hypothetical protein [Microbacterium sp. Yaish 1]|uniref:hypothetical protein n=1 Tax=Microbacterium sp. Yaish 1 TaxID=2025014 RepID=UPI000B942E05|nr:hypothetical protein [Microbacterium sp. Yaish 1]OYC97601.1 hypothetical protein CI089_03430 [Microbacterium sp. Yaish 1]
MPRLLPIRAVLLAAGVLAALTASASLTVVPASASASASAPEPPAIEWGVVPADAAGPDGRVSLRHTIDPGAAITDAIAVTNHSVEPAVFTVAAGDGVVGADGAYDVRADDPEAGGAWIDVGGLDGDGLALAAGETRVLPVTITVPADATPGDHPAGIVVGLSAAESGVTVTHRVGVRVHLQVAGEIAPALRIDAATASFTPSWIPFVPGTLTVEYQVTNTGNVRFGVSGAAEAAGPLGLLPGGGGAEAFEVLPGGTATQRIELPLAPLFLAAGEVTVTPISLGDDRVPLPEAASAGFSATAVPWSSMVVLAVGAGSIVLVAVIALRRRAR